MEQQEIIRYFDRCAPTWDAGLVRNEAVISEILEHAGIGQGMDVLDVACGTGVLFPDYLGRGVASLTAIDISPEMAKLAREKFPTVRVLCGDVEQTAFEKRFDAIMVYNALPHFPDPARLIGCLAALLKPEGRLSVAHGMSREHILRHHAGSAQHVSIDLLDAETFAELFRPYFTVEVCISDERMYQVVGRKK